MPASAIMADHAGGREERRVREAADRAARELVEQPEAGMMPMTVSGMAIITTTGMTKDRVWTTSRM